MTFWLVCFPCGGEILFFLSWKGNVFLLKGALFRYLLNAMQKMWGVGMGEVGIIGTKRSPN